MNTMDSLVQFLLYTLAEAKMAVQICLSEQKFDEVFQRVEREYSHNHKFMLETEYPKEFEGSDRHKMLVKFRATISQLKYDLRTT